MTKHALLKEQPMGGNPNVCEHGFRFENALCPFADCGASVADERTLASTLLANSTPVGEAGVPFDPGTGPMPGYVAGRCGHRVAESEWRAGYRTCEHCPSPSAEKRAELAHEDDEVLSPYTCLDCRVQFGHTSDCDSQ